jgi:hypothetical protein
MYPFPDYYAQFGIVLKNTPYASLVPLRYEIHEEIICIIVFLMLLGIEIFISIVQVLKDGLKVKTKMSNNDILQVLYEQQMDMSSATTKSSSSVNDTTNQGVYLLLNTPVKTMNDIDSTISTSTTKF